LARAWAGILEEIEVQEQTLKYEFQEESICCQLDGRETVGNPNQ
jgi:hypothetical protein